MILLARHGETDWNAAGRWMGQCEVSLNDRGREQARALELDEPPPVVVASTLGRAAETAAIVAARYGLQPELDERLMESARGAWEGLTGAEIEARDPVKWAEWREGRPDFRFPDGESIEEHRRRTRLALADMPDGALAVSHGGTIRCAFMTEIYPHDLKVPNGKLHRLPT